MLRVISELNRAVQIGLSYSTTAGDALVLITADDEWRDLIVERVDDSDESGHPKGVLATSADNDPFDVVNRTTSSRSTGRRSATSTSGFRRWHLVPARGC